MVCITLKTQKLLIISPSRLSNDVEACMITNITGQSLHDCCIACHVSQLIEACLQETAMGQNYI